MLEIALGSVISTELMSELVCYVINCKRVAGNSLAGGISLSLVVVVPEPRDQGHLGQIIELSLKPRDVKDAPLAPQSAF